MKTQTNYQKNGSHDQRVMPSAPDLERAVLGALLLEAAAFAEVALILKPEMFYVAAHGAIYHTMVGMDAAGSKLDLLLVLAELKKRDLLEAVGGLYFVTKLTNDVVSGANIESHARIILQKWIYRELIRQSQETLNACYSEAMDPFDLLDESQAGCQDIEQVAAGTTSADYKTLLRKNLEKIYNNDGTQPNGVLSGIKSLDRIIGAFTSKLYLIAARPSVGKTALMVELVSRMTSGPRAVPVGVLELETSDTDFVHRHLANRSGVDMFALKAGGLTEAQRDRVSDAAHEVYDQPVIADFVSEINVTAIRSKARTWKKKYGIKILLIDYIQIIEADYAMQKMSREQQVTQMAVKLAALAKQLDIPVIAFAQLSREVLKRGDKRPILSDLRESGGLEQTARVVMFLHRPEVFGEALDANGETLPEGATEIIVAKNNEGPVGTAHLFMQAKYSRFRDASEAPPDDADMPF